MGTGSRVTDSRPHWFLPFQSPHLGLRVPLEESHPESRATAVSHAPTQPRMGGRTTQSVGPPTL